jgi:predicted  nucleic acid-binding Zn-ribbon protein
MTDEERAVAKAEGAVGYHEREVEALLDAAERLIGKRAKLVAQLADVDAAIATNEAELEAARDRLADAGVALLELRPVPDPAPVAASAAAHNATVETKER